MSFSGAKVAGKMVDRSSIMDVRFEKWDAGHVVEVQIELAAVGRFFFGRELSMHHVTHLLAKCPYHPYGYRSRPYYTLSHSWLNGW